MGTVTKRELVVNEATGLMVRYSKNIDDKAMQLMKVIAISDNEEVANLKDAIMGIVRECNKVIRQGDRIHYALEIGSMKQEVFSAFANIDKPCGILPEHRDFYTHNGMLGFYPDENGNKNENDLRTLGRLRLTPYNSGHEIFQHFLNAEIIHEIENGKKVSLLRKDHANRPIVCNLDKKNGSQEANWLFVFNSCKNAPTFEIAPQRTDRCFFLDDVLLIVLVYYKFIFHNMITGEWSIGSNDDKKIYRTLIWSKTGKPVTKDEISNAEVILPEPYEYAYKTLMARHEMKKNNKAQELETFILDLYKSLQDKLSKLSIK